MPSVHASNFSAAAAENHMAHFGETVTYRNRAGAERSIMAIIERGARRDLGGQEKSHTPALTVKVLNRATSIADDGFGGISTAEINLGGDQLDLAERAGAAVTPRHLKALAESSESFLVLEVR